MTLRGCMCCRPSPGSTQPSRGGTVLGTLAQRQPALPCLARPRRAKPTRRQAQRLELADTCACPPAAASNNPPPSQTPVPHVRPYPPCRTCAPHPAQEGVDEEGGGPPVAPEQRQPKVVGPAPGEVQQATARHAGRAMRASRSHKHVVCESWRPCRQRRLRGVVYHTICRTAQWQGAAMCSPVLRPQEQQRHQPSKDKHRESAGTGAGQGDKFSLSSRLAGGACILGERKGQARCVGCSETRRLLKSDCIANSKSLTLGARSILTRAHYEPHARA